MPPRDIGLAAIGMLDIIDTVTLFFLSMSYDQEDFPQRQHPGQPAAVVWRRRKSKGPTALGPLRLGKQTTSQWQLGDRLSSACAKTDQTQGQQQS